MRGKLESWQLPWRKRGIEILEKSSFLENGPHDSHDTLTYAQTPRLRIARGRKSGSSNRNAGNKFAAKELLLPDFGFLTRQRWEWRFIKAHNLSTTWPL
jgi:hypothetical protein